MKPAAVPRASLAASYSRYSTDLQQAESIADQQRKCREHAARLGLTIPPELEFADEAVSGTKLARAGLDRLLADARAGRFAVLVLENLSRLARESVITLPLLKELAELRKIRVLSIGEGIDTERPGWELSAVVVSLQHERYVKDLGGYVFRGQEGVVLAGHSVGDMCFGYTSEPIAGSEATRRGRHPKPRMRYVIDPEQAPWVERIFRWFVDEGRSMRWIARELTRLGAPKNHRATTPAWHPQSVRRALANPKYIGLWPWGRRANRRNPFDGRVSKEERPPEEARKWDRTLPDLRIIAADLWDAAQARLARCAHHGWPRRPNGQLAGSAPGGDAHAPRHLLHRLLACAHCGSALHVRGADGKYLGCSGYQTGRCDCETGVPRDRAERAIVGAIAGRILADGRWHRAVLVALDAEHRALEAQLPARSGAARTRLAAVEGKIARLHEQPEDHRVAEFDGGLIADG